MEPIGVCVCEVCGTQSADHAGWFSIAGAGTHIEILPWNDGPHARTDCHHACCGDHLQQLIFSNAARELSKRPLPLSVRRGGWNPATLVPPADAKAEQTKEEIILNVLSEIDAVLHGPPEEEEETPRFDA